MFPDFLSHSANLVGLLTLPGSAYLATLSIAALQRPRPQHDSRPFAGRIAVVMPAHNEAESIAATLADIGREARRDGRCSVHVIADNCSDDTARVARATGAHVLERNDATLRGKGHALDFAFQRLVSSDAEWFIVIDADSRLAPGFLDAMRTAMGHKLTGALQAAYLGRPASGLRGRLSRLAQIGYNLVRNQGRARLGASSAILGNGFALHRETLARVPYRAGSVVEDLEYQLRLNEADIPVCYVPEARITGEVASSSDGARIQRNRWEGGRLRMAIDHLPTLAGRLLRGETRLLEPCADLALLPVGLQVMLATAAAAGGALGAFAAGTCAAAVALYLIAIARSGEITLRDAGALAGAPFYLAWKLLLLPSTLLTSRRNATWVRTPRTATNAQTE